MISHTSHTAHAGHYTSGGAVTQTFVTDLACVQCAHSVERMLRANPHITSARVDYGDKTVHVTFHAGMIDAPAIQALISHAAHGCRCETEGDDGEALGGHLEGLAHHAQMAPITMNTNAVLLKRESTRLAQIGTSTA